MTNSESRKRMQEQAAKSTESTESELLEDIRRRWTAPVREDFPTDMAYMFASLGWNMSHPLSVQADIQALLTLLGAEDV